MVALGVPVAAAINWSVIQHSAARPARDLLPAVLHRRAAVGAADPAAGAAVRGSPHDIGLLALLGVGQLAIPCLLSVAAARVLECARGGAARPAGDRLRRGLGLARRQRGAGRHVLGGGPLVIAALAANEALALRQRG